MKRAYGVSLEDRLRIYNEAEARLGEVAVRWLDARVLGPVPAGLESELAEARRVVRRAEDALRSATSRQAKRAKEAA